MITIDKPVAPKSLNRANSRPTAKKGAYKAEFKDAVLEGASSEHIPDINAINPFLFLHEIGEYKDDQEKLKEMGTKILSCLNDIKFGLINGEFQKDNIINLKKVLEENKYRFKFLELQHVIEDIILRSEVELAKIEMVTETKEKNI